MTETTTIQIQKLAAIVRPYLPAAIDRWGSLEAALPKLIALLALEGE